jgi:hypothetical protein
MRNPREPNFDPGSVTGRFAFGFPFDQNAWDSLSFQEEGGGIGKSVFL